MRNGEFAFGGTIKGLLALLFVGAFLALSVAPASALDNGHSFSFSFTPTGTAAFSTGITALDVDNSAGPSAGDVYVVDQNNERVEKFSPTGAFILMFGDDVDATTGGDVCTATSGDVCQAGTAGFGADQFSSPRYLAVDQSAGSSAGDVYVADVEQRVVHKFDEDGNLITSWGEGGVVNGTGFEAAIFANILGIDVDGSGLLLVSNDVNGSESEETGVYKFSQSGAPAAYITTHPGDTGEGFAWAPGHIFRMRQQWLRRANDANGSEVVTVSANPYPHGETYLYPRALTADSSTGTAYVSMENYSGGQPRVWEFQFNGSGQPLDSAGSPCAATLTEVGEGCDPTHEFGADVLTQSQGVAGIAVNASNHEVYVAERATGSIEVFVDAPAPVAETGGPIARTTVSGTVRPDSAGEVTECYFEYGTSATYGEKQACDQATPFAADEAVSAELPLEGETLYHYRLVARNASGATGFGADETFTPHNVQGVETLEAKNVTRTGARLEGSFEGNGEATNYYFEWGKTTAYGTTSAVPPGPSAGSPTFPPASAVHFDAESLAPETEYHYRLVAKNGLGTTQGNDETFKTLPAVQSLTAEAAEPVNRTSANLKGSYLGDGDGTTYKIEWGKTISYGNSTTVKDAGSSSQSTPLSDEISGLELETTYHFRLAATNSLGTTHSNDQEFTTLPAVPSLSTKPATDITQDGISLNGEYAGNGEDTKYYFEYGLTTKYGQTTSPTIDAGPENGPTHLSTVITNFEDYSTYHYRVVAENDVGTTYGPDLTFQSDAAPLPSITATRSSVQSGTSATLEAEINPNRWATVYLFEYGPSTTYGEETESGPSIGSDQYFHPVSSTVSNLQPGTTYHYRAIAINFTGTAYGPDQVLVTPNVPRVDSSSASAIGQASAHLSAGVDPNSSPTSIHFEYGTTAVYGASTAEMSIGDGAEDQAVGVDLAGLAPATTYHFRVLATNPLGVTPGPDQTFTTLGAVEQQQTEPKPRCKKGFVKRHGNCVKKPKHKKRHRHPTHSHGTGGRRG